MRKFCCAAGFALLPVLSFGKPLPGGGAAFATRGHAVAGAMVAAPRRAFVARGPASGRSHPAGTMDTRSVPPSAVRIKGRVTGWQPPEHDIPSRPDPENLPPPTAPFRANEVDDAPRNRPALAPRLGDPTISFSGIEATGMVPPDPVLAVGPNHVVAAVNSDWAIFTKDGTSLFQTSASSWFHDSVPGLGSDPLGNPYDPQVIYDSFSGRWVLLYLATDQKTESWILISVSNTSDPNGHWVNYAVRGDENGSTSAANWTDFPAMAVDANAIYVATNQFTYSDNTFIYSKVRVFDKAPLYAGTDATWTDFWDLRDPGSPDTTAFSLRPAETFSASPAEYLVSNSGFQTRTYVTLWSITGAGSQNLDISGVNVPVTATTAPPDADQPGGSPGTTGCPTPCLIDTGDGRITSAVYRNGSLWFAHAVAGGTDNAYSRARYVRLDTVGHRADEDQSLGTDGCWYFYPAIAVDPSENLVMVFGRSCDDKYAGARFTARSANDSSLQSSTALKAGETSYVSPIGSTTKRNRWGDYFRAAVDPASPAQIWLVGEYASSPEDTWGTFIARTAVICSAPAIPTASSNGPIAEGQTLQLTAVSSPGAAYSWSGPNGFESSLQNPAIPNAAAANSGTYTVTASFGDCSSLTGSVEVTVVTAAGGGCSPSASTLCLSNGRFSVTARWQKNDGSSGQGTAVSLTADTGYFWFFGPTNIEVVTKVLNACGIASHAYWVFAAGLTNVGVTLTYTDTATGTVRNYQNTLGVPFKAIQDTHAFATCP